MDEPKIEKDFRENIANIPVQKVGIIVFISHLVSLVAKFLYVIIITRILPAADFGVWNNISDLLVLFGAPALMVAFWAKRFIARGYVDATKTCLAATGMLAIILSVIYIISLPLITLIFGVHNKISIYLLSTILLVDTIFITGFEAILNVVKPTALGYGMLLMHVVKLILVLLAISFMKQIEFIIAILLVIIAAQSMRVGYYALVSRKYIRGKINWKFAFEWAKGTPLNVYERIIQQLNRLPLMLLVFYGGVVARAYYGAAESVGWMATYPRLVAVGLYPTLLAGERTKNVAPVVRLVIMLTVPVIYVIFFYGDVLLSLLNPLYTESQTAAVFISLSSGLFGIAQTLQQTIFGLDRFDEKAKIPLRKLTKTMVFVAISAYWTHSIIANTVAFVIFPMIKDPFLMATYLAATYALCDFIVLMIYVYILKKHYHISLEGGKVLRVLLAAIPGIAIIYLLKPFSLTGIPLVDALLVSLLSLTVYLLVVMSVDENVRRLMKRLIAMLRNRKRVVS